MQGEQDASWNKRTYNRNKVLVIKSAKTTSWVYYLQALLKLKKGKNFNLLKKQQLFKPD